VEDCKKITLCGLKTHNSSLWGKHPYIGESEALLFGELKLGFFSPSKITKKLLAVQARAILWRLTVHHFFIRQVFTL